MESMGGDMTTFADKILSEPCDHEWYVEHQNWAGTGLICIYCDEKDYRKNEVKLMDC